MLFSQTLTARPSHTSRPWTWASLSIAQPRGTPCGVVRTIIPICAHLTLFET